MVPDAYRELLLRPGDPGESYRLCLELLAREERTADYALTETLVYGCEVRYALQVLSGEPPPLYNFGDLDGRGSELLWRVLDPMPVRRVAFVGAGPYPVTALLVRQRYPEAEVTCFDNNLVAYLLGEAVLRRLDPSLSMVWAEAREVDYSPFTAVVVAAMVNAKSQLVERLLATSEAQLIVRGECAERHPRLHSLASGFGEDGALA